MRSGENLTEKQITEADLQKGIMTVVFLLIIIALFALGSCYFSRKIPDRQPYPAHVQDFSTMFIVCTTILRILPDDE